MTDGEFNFKIRDELKKMAEFKSLSKNWPWMMLKWLTTQLVTVEMFIDMVTYSSRGDLDLAVKDLKASKQFIDRCLEFLGLWWIEERYVRRCYEWLFQIWRREFIKTKCVLDWGHDVSNGGESCQRVLEEEMASMDVVQPAMDLHARVY